MNVPTVVTIFTGIIVILKLLGYIALGWYPILTTICVVYGFMFLMVVFSLALLNTKTNSIQKHW